MTPYLPTPRALTPHYLTTAAAVGGGHRQRRSWPLRRVSLPPPSLLPSSPPLFLPTPTPLTLAPPPNPCFTTNHRFHMPPTWIYVPLARICASLARGEGEGGRCIVVRHLVGRWVAAWLLLATLAALTSSGMVAVLLGSAASLAGRSSLWDVAASRWCSSR